MEENSHIEKAKKLYALYNNSGATTSESIAAKAMLDKLLKKHNLTIDSILNEQRTERKFQYYTKHDLTILAQCVYSIFGDMNKPDVSYNRFKKIAFCKLTDFEYLEIIELYDFHRYEFWKVLQAHKKAEKLLMSAYIVNQNIYPDSVLVQKRIGKEKPRKNSYQDLMDILALSSMMKVEKRNKTKRLNEQN